MKFTALIILVLMLVISPVLAAPGKNENNPANGQGQGNSKTSNPGKQDNNQGNSDNDNSKSDKNEGKKEQNQEDKSGSNKKLGVSGNPTATSSGSENCDPNYPWKNHGEYVSCVAKLKPGGQSVSEAAKSDIGKKNKNATSSASPSGLPSPSATESATPSASPSPEVTSSGVISTITNSLVSIQDVVTNLKDQIAALLDLLNPFN